MKRKRSSYVIISILLVFTLASFSITTNIYYSKNGKVKFVSEAPLEIIKASSGKLAGVLNINDKTFVFTVPMKSFNGFNSPLQKVHFNENYIESNKYPSASFRGKIIEDINFKKPGKHKIRAKGKFTIHGKTNPMNIRCNLKITNNEIEIDTRFVVYLKDHAIEIPSIVNQKLSEKINVFIKSTLKQKK